MKNLRKYGRESFNVAVIHGGPGAPGGMAPVARSLSQICGILEPLQTADSVDGQILELKSILNEYGNLPVILIGHSWGAWLSYMFAAKYPTLVKKLILVGSGPYEEKYVSVMNEIRQSRFTENDNLKVKTLMESLNDPNNENREETFKEFGKVMSKADSFAPISSEGEALEFQPDIFEKIMNEVMYLRKKGELVAIGRKIECPVIAIHGDFDPHPFEGVEKPLSQVIKDFKFILLKNCGHTPWNEIYGEDIFYEILKKEILYAKNK